MSIYLYSALQGLEAEDLGSSLPWLVGCYCSYLLPKQAGGTPQILIDRVDVKPNKTRGDFMLIFV